MAPRGEQEDNASGTESDSSSDRSSASSYRLASVSSDDDYDDNAESRPSNEPRARVWASIQGTITSLQQLALTVRFAGARHRQERIHRFKKQEHNRQVYEVVKRCARQMVDFRFPKSSEVLRERVAESIATRRMRFSYLEQHQKKTSTLNESPQELNQTQTTQQHKGQPIADVGQHQDSGSLPPEIREQRLPVQPSVILSTTERTKLDPKRLQAGQRSAKRPESVSSVKISTGSLPSRPKLNPEGTSFTCPYCFLVCPAKEVSDQAQWMSHLIHDFEPFFCVFNDCISPFTCADTYIGWLAHMQKAHTQPRWHCWHCADTPPFFSAAEFEIHLEGHHSREVADTLRPTLIKHSLVHERHALQDCPFCGGFPEEIEKDLPDRDGKQAQEALEKHVRDHLVSVALFLAPVGEDEDGLHSDDTQSDAQRGNQSDRGFDNISEAEGLECHNHDCDCKETEKDSTIDRQPLDEDNLEIITQIWKDILQDKVVQQGGDTPLLDPLSRLKSSLFSGFPSTPLMPKATPLTLQGRLWNQAYDNVKARDLKFVKAYEDILSEEFWHCGPGSIYQKGTEIGQHWETRFLQIRKLVSALYLRDRAEFSRVTRDRSSQALRQLWDLAGAACIGVPEAAVAWIGVCLGLEILCDPVTEPSGHRADIAYVLSRMHWYWSLVTHFLELIEYEQSSVGLQAQLESQVMQLYEKVLSYQIGMVCLYFCNQAAVDFRESLEQEDPTRLFEPAKLEIIKDKVHGIQDTEDAVERNIALYNTEGGTMQLRQIKEVTRTAEVDLQNTQLLSEDQVGQLENRLQTCERRCGREGLSTFHTASRLGSVYKDQGRLEEARATLERAKSGFSKLLGTGHTLTLITSDTLIEVYKEQDDHEQAKLLNYQTVLRRRELDYKRRLMMVRTN